MRILCSAVPALFAATLSLSTHAAVVNVDVGTPLARFALLKPGTHHYLRFMRTPAPGADAAKNQPITAWRMGASGSP